MLKNETWQPVPGMEHTLLSPIIKKTNITTSNAFLFQSPQMIMIIDPGNLPEHLMPNKLAHQTSPYLLQHADNPVDWYPWGEEALSRARAEEKPIFLSIGYAACHWCHVMAHESFEDPAVAVLMNEHFINIKVDREERPDLDSIYMSATVALSGSGGWPMSVFLTPDLRPFYAGTYFPPVPRYNMPSFRDLLTAIATAWQNERDKIFRIAEQVLENIRSNTFPTGKAAVPLTQALLDNAADHLQKTYDWVFGGWGEAPKFPQPLAIEFLLDRATQPGQPERRENCLKMVSHALHSMARGGIYDVVGGGFARYSTDKLWPYRTLRKCSTTTPSLRALICARISSPAKPNSARSAKKLWTSSNANSPTRRAAFSAVLMPTPREKKANSTPGVMTKSKPSLRMIFPFSKAPTG